MSIATTCINCGQTEKFPAAMAGKGTQCKKCNQYIIVPGVAVAVPSDIDYRSQETTDPKKRSPLQILNGVFGTLFSILIGLYAGLMVIIPIGILVVVGLILGLSIRLPRKHLAAPAAIMIAHAIWILVGLLTVQNQGIALTESESALIYASILIPIGGSIWLLVKPSWIAVGVNSAFELFMIVTVYLAMIPVNVGTLLHKGLAIHLYLHILATYACIAMYITYLKARDAKKSAAPMPTW